MTLSWIILISACLTFTYILLEEIVSIFASCKLQDSLLLWVHLTMSHHRSILWFWHESDVKPLCELMTMYMGTLSSLLTPCNRGALVTGGFLSQKTNSAEFWCLLLCPAAERSVEQTVDLRVSEAPWGYCDFPVMRSVFKKFGLYNHSYRRYVRCYIHFIFIEPSKQGYGFIAWRNIVLWTYISTEIGERLQLCRVTQKKGMIMLNLGLLFQCHQGNIVTSLSYLMQNAWKVK